MSEQNRQARTGFFLMVVATTALGVFPSAARFAYDGGATPETVSAMRHFLTAVFLAVIVRRQHRRAMLDALALPRRLIGPALGLGLILAVYSYSYIAAVRFVPVSLAVLLLYTFPIQVVLVAAISGGERLRPARLASLVLAFAGIAVALGVDPEGLDMRGIVLGAIAGVGLAALTILAARLSAPPAGRAITFHLALVATLVTAGIIAVGPGFSFPETALAWTGFAIAASSAALGIVLYFLALPLIGPVHAALLSNLEPVVAVIAAAAFLGEYPGWQRMGGIGLVLLAIVILQVETQRPHPRQT